MQQTGLCLWWYFCVMANMRYPPGQKIDVYAQAVKGLSTLETDTNKQAKYLDFIDIYSDLDDNELQQYRESYPEEVNKMTAFAERFRNEGLEQGLERWCKQPAT